MTLPDPKELPLPPRSFTTFFRYALALSTYFGGYASAYLAFILLASVPATREMMSDILTSLGVQIDQVVGSPAWGAVLVTAILPSVKGFKQVDDWGRGRLQDFASIPVKAKLISEELVDHLKGGKLEINENSSRQQISAAIKIHRERFEHLQTAWKKLHQITAPIAGRRYRKFYKENDQKIMQRFEHEFAGRPAEGKTLDLASARHIEDHHREAVLRLARYIICGMLLSEGTEYRVRDRLKNELKINVKQNALNFGFKHLVVLVIMVIVVIVSTYFSAFIYHLWYGVSPICTSAAGHYDCSAHAELREIFSHNIQFFGWGIQTFIMYALPIAVAAAAAMFKLDQKASKSALNPIDYLFLAILTFAATAMLCFFMLLAFGITIPKYLGGTELKLNVLVPWIIPPALVVQCLCGSPSGTMKPGASSFI